MAVPALVYLAIAGSTAPRGWAVPMATDIALAVAVALERGVHPWASFVVVPVFALANAGITVTGAGLRDAFGSALTWGIVAGLVLGKPIGVLAGRAILTRDTPPRLAGIGAAAGIGFTVALFIAELAFDDPIQHDQAKLAILVASLLAGCLSTALLRRP